VKLALLARVALITLGSPLAVFAQSPQASPPPPQTAHTRAPEEEDKTGTNPAKFMKTLILLNEFRSLGDEHGFDEFTFRYIEPIGKVKLQLSLPLDYSDATGVAEAGFGEAGLKASYKARMTRRYALIFNLDTTYPTATKSTFGFGKYLASPGATFAFFFRQGSVIFAPSLQQKFSYAGDATRAAVNQTLVDLYFVWKPKKSSWLIVDPQFVVDLEADTFYTFTEVELGRLMFGGVGSYVRPGIAIGKDRPADWNIEFGVKVVH